MAANKYQQHMGALVNGAMTFPIKESGLSAAQVIGGAAKLRTMTKWIVSPMIAEAKSISDSARLARLGAYPAELSAGSSGLAGGASAGIWSAAAIAAGLARLGEASLEGKAINNLRTWVNIYSNTYAECVAKYAVALIRGEKVNIGLGSSLLPPDLVVWEQKAYRDVHLRLSLLGEEKATEAFRHLVARHGSEHGIAAALRRPVRDLVIKNADESIRTLIVTGDKKEPEYYPDPFDSLKWPKGIDQPNQADANNLDEGLLPSKSEGASLPAGRLSAAERDDYKVSAQVRSTQPDTDRMDEGLLPAKSEGLSVVPQATAGLDADGDKLPDYATSAPHDALRTDPGLLPSQSEGAAIARREAVKPNVDEDNLLDQSRSALFDLERSWFDDAQTQTQTQTQSQPTQQPQPLPPHGPYINHLEVCRPGTDPQEEEYEVEEPPPVDPNWVR